MALLLNIETSVPICSVSIANDGICLAESRSDTANDHIAQLTSLIIETLKKTRNKLKDLDAIAVSSGPGSYTGLRIGVSTAKGMCHAINKPLIAVNTLRSMVEPLLSVYKQSDTLFCPLIDARRLEVYTAIYNRIGETIMPPQPLLFEETGYSEFLNQAKVIFFGSGLDKGKPFLQHQNAVFHDDHEQISSNLSALSFARYQNEEFEDLAYFEPEYIKEFYSTKK